MNRVVSSKSQGFTLIELLLAMTFISILLVVIAVTVIQISNTYNKGLTMKAVDQAGRALSTDMRLVLSQSQPFSTATAYHEQRHPGSSQDEPDGGRLCLGTYSYIWNFGKSMTDPINKYINDDETEIRFARVRDNGGQYCANPSSQILRSDATELLSGGDRDLAIQNFAIERVADDPTVGQALYRITLVIGTNNRDSIEPLTTIDTVCKPPTDELSLEEFCAVNRFDFTAQAGNKGGQ